MSDAHSIKIEPCKKFIRVFAGGEIIADTDSALVLSEADYAPVHYIPRSDVRIDLLEPSEKTSFCPYKGLATYFSIKTGRKRFKDAIWCYETPLDSVEDIADYLAFYPDRVDSIELYDKDPNK